MATYHLRAKVRTRHNTPIASLQHAAYLARDGRKPGRPPHATIGQEHMQYLARTEKTRGDLVFYEHVNMPSWAENNGLRFWESADRHERARGTIYREMEVMIPRELSPGQWIPLAREFSQQTLGERHPYTLAVHAPPDRKTGAIQPHFHLMYSTRTHDGPERSEDQYWKQYNSREPEKGGAPKERSWDKKERLYEVRREWAVLANTYLEREGHDIRIDHRSLKDQSRDVDRARLVDQVQDLSRDLQRVERERVAMEQEHMRTLARAHVPERKGAWTKELEDLFERNRDGATDLRKVDHSREIERERQNKELIREYERRHPRDDLPQRQVARHTREPTMPTELVRAPHRKLTPKLEPGRDRDDEWMGF